MIYILGLLARAGHGKTTAAQHLVARAAAATAGATAGTAAGTMPASGGGVEVCIRSLAGPMKRAVKNVFGFSDAQLWGSQTDKEAVDPRYGFSPRWLLQRLGTEGLRDEFGDDVHLRALLVGLRREEAARAPGAPPCLYVVDDVRFPNDAAFISAGGADFTGAVLKLVATDAPAGPNATHASEQAIDQVSPADIGATVVASRAAGIPLFLSAIDRVLRDGQAFERLRPLLRRLAEERGREIPPADPPPVF